MGKTSHKIFFQPWEKKLHKKRTITELPIEDKTIIILLLKIGPHSVLVGKASFLLLWIFHVKENLLETVFWFFETLGTRGDFSNLELCCFKWLCYLFKAFLYFYSFFLSFFCHSIPTPFLVFETKGIVYLHDSVGNIIASVCTDRIFLVLSFFDKKNA